MTASPADHLLRTLDDGVLTLTLNRPDRLNALTWAMIERLTAEVAASGSDPAVRVVVIAGAGRAFCSGDDIVGGMSGEGRPTSSREIRQRLLDPATRGPHHALVRTFLSTPKPIVAALHGRCHGAGWVIALSCDFRVARADALIGDIRAEKAIFANQGVGLLLPRQIGASRAMDLLMTGRVIDAVEAERYGIVTRLWSPEAYDAELAAFVGGLAAGPTKTYAAWKGSVNRAPLLELDAYTDHERLLDLTVFDSADILEGVRAFGEKRPPRFTGQ